MEYPPVKPHHKALHELRKGLVYEHFRASFDHILELAGEDPFAQLEVCYDYYDSYVLMEQKEAVHEVMRRAHEIPYSDDRATRALALILNARYSRFLHDVKAFTRQVDEALALLTEKSSGLYFLALRIKSTNYLAEKKYDEAIRTCREILHMAESNLVDTIATVYNRLGSIYDMIGEYDEADANFQRSLALYLQLGYKSSIAGSYSNLARLHFRHYEADPTSEQGQEHLQRMLAYGDIALKVISGTSCIGFKINILANLGYGYADAKDFTKAIRYGKESLEIARKANLKTSLATGLLMLGSVLEKAGLYEESLLNLEECIEHSYSLGGELKATLYQKLSVVSSRLSQWEKAFGYSQEHVKLRHEFDEKAKIGIVYHNKLLGEELHQLQLRSLEEKMQLQTVQLVSQTDLLYKFRNDLRAIVREIDEPIAALKRIKEKLKELPCAQIDWTKFEAQFNEVHPDFRSKLHLKFPELTEMEQRIAVMVRMDLKSADIAKLFCITERAVEFHRLNLRKKLHLKQGETLPKFLQGI